ncbi:alpha/beta fold hydrolase [Glycomyces tenuis]|uniref:alpha/beta fold hydrolase n=1 Tax=Glycomyces tenuis TaxID=58116 RepID=UPI00042A6974|nr:alpha/beta fold hydrolase [Glycomyces tenuis]
MRATPLIAVSAAALAAALTVSTIPADSQEPEPDPGGDFAASIDWEPCEADPTADCGVMDVPLEWDDPGGETIGINVTRRPAENPDERVGSLVVQAGKASPSALVVLYMPEFLGQELRDKFDIVGFDLRGVGFSSPLVCDEELVEAKPDSYLESGREFRELVDYNQRLRDDCVERNGDLYSNVDTLSVVRDVDALRGALGEDRLDFLGFSYGSFIGAQYAEEYPDRVRTLALDSNVDHSLDVVDWVGLKAEMMQDLFEKFVEWCEGDERCALYGSDVREVWHSVMDRADRGELSFTGDPEHEVTAYDVVSGLFHCGYGPNWTATADYLASLHETGVAEGLPCPSEDDDDGETPVEIPDTDGYMIANFCSDYALPVRNFGQWQRLIETAGERYAPDVRFHPNALDRIRDCLSLEDGVVNPQHELEVETDAPILLVNARYDPITGHNTAVRIAEQIGDEAFLLTYEGAVHGAYGTWSGSDCVTEAMHRYLVDRELPEVDSCPEVPYEP